MPHGTSRIAEHRDLEAFAARIPPHGTSPEGAVLTGGSLSGFRELAITIRPLLSRQSEAASHT